MNEHACLSSDVTDRELADCCRANNAAGKGMCGIAFEKLWERHYEYICCSLRRFNDFAHDSATDALKRLNNHERPLRTNNIRGWLCKTAHRMTLDKIRHYNGRRVSLASDPVDRHRKDLAAVNRAIEELLTVLSPEQRELVRLYYLESVSYAELARRFGKPPGTIRSLVHRARVKMRAADSDAEEFCGV